VCEIQEALNNGAFVKPYESEIMRLNQYDNTGCERTLARFGCRFSLWTKRLSAT